jgi:hypothetical protein
MTNTLTHPTDIERPSIERLTLMINEALHCVSKGEVFPNDRLTDMLLDMRTLAESALKSQLSLARHYSDLLKLHTVRPTEPTFELVAKGMVLAETEDHDVMACCLKRGEWMIVIFKAGTDTDGVEVEGVFDRDGVRRFVTDMFNSERKG